MNSVQKYFEVGRDNDIQAGTCRLCKTKLRYNGGSTNRLQLHVQKKTRTRECDKLKEKGVKTKILLEHFEATKYCIHDGKVDESDASEVDVDSDDES